MYLFDAKIVSKTVEEKPFVCGLLYYFYSLTRNKEEQSLGII